MISISKRTSYFLAAFVGLAVSGSAGSAMANDGRVTEVSMRGYATHKIVRTRTQGKRSVTFSAEPERIEPSKVIVFEIRSITDRGALQRWRCVAINDVSECLGAPVKIRYLEGEQRTEMSVAVRPTVAKMPLRELASR